jgi:VanZ family protein
VRAPGDPGPKAFAATPIGAWLLVLLWVLIIFVVSSQPDLDDVGRNRLRIGVSSGGHALFFGALALLVSNALMLHRPTRVVWWTVVLVSAFAVLDELHQVLVPGRDPSIVDLAADALGALTGAVAWVSVAGRPAAPAATPADQHVASGGIESDETPRRGTRQESPGS